MARAVRRGEVTAVDLVRASLRRIDALEPDLGAVVTRVDERALAEARQADEAVRDGRPIGPLHGVPLTIKDSFDTEGVRSAAGTPGRREHVPATDATAVARLRRAGAVLVGKTNTPELTLSYETDNGLFGPTRHPSGDAELSPGGSSGGAAALVAAGAVPCELGSDTGGSIRLPAALCGLVGLKPTAGRVSRAGHVIGPSGHLDVLTVIGPLARDVDDVELLLSLVAGPDERDPALAPVPLRPSEDVDVGQLRVATWTDNGLAAATPEVATAVAAAASRLADLGATVAEQRPPGVEASHELYSRVFRADGFAWIRRLLDAAGTADIERPERREGAVEPVTSGALGALLEEWCAWRAALLPFASAFDVALCPVHTHARLPHGFSKDPELLLGASHLKTWNLAGWPAASVPVRVPGQDAPIAVQVVSGPWREDVVLAAARALVASAG